mmetsp:Transcript_72437/g.125583  ORF Transcript_72437/g.125583 Transcript_72437/m.125583 type:complete len:100 (+) Transcript_72437:70-369(+)
MSLLHGEYNEAAARASFQEAVMAWRKDRAASGNLNAASVAPGDNRKAASEPFQVGETVYARDYEEQSWICGTVTSTDPLRVQPRGKPRGLSFEHVQRNI